MVCWPLTLAASKFCGFLPIQYCLVGDPSMVIGALGATWSSTLQCEVLVFSSVFIFKHTLGTKLSTFFTITVFLSSSCGCLLSTISTFSTFSVHACLTLGPFFLSQYFLSTFQNLFLHPFLEFLSSPLSDYSVLLYIP